MAGSTARESFFDDLSSDLDSYFTGPIDATKSSKLPYFMRVRGSVLPGLILPMLFVAAWCVWITCVHKLVRPLAIDSLLLTVLGFLVGLALSFRSSTAYERYNDGRKCWANLTLNVRNIARLIWIHVRERDDSKEDDVLAKLTAMNLLLAFCVALKHKLRHQPEYDYKDLQGLIVNIQSFAKQAHRDGDIPPRKALTTPQRISAYLGITFFEKNPIRRYKAYKKAGKNHGNLPLEIMTYLSSYLDSAVQGEQLKVPAYQSMAMTYLGGMMDSLTNCERISQTPLPLAYNIVISQITWLYVLFLPFQLVSKLGWVSIPGTLIGAYIILGFAAIGREIEDPFGDDVNDLNLDRYCDSIALELDMILSVAPPKPSDFIQRDDNYVMFPNMNEGYKAWKAKGIEKIRSELKQKPLRHANPALAREIRQSELRDRDHDLDKRQREEDEREEAAAKGEQQKKKNEQAQVPADDAV
ncbi:hypothetical protein AOL_s00054g388 [Orbilia oligospora ATCC 24927]|uniref:Uncharacterized protein n=2 Tax=Orbilia oligospora TaxID=2813651 RepID=G1X694_ARTOA|nr:hypothetical protein AOL_s00054g388 [Orbilia oligospora ATCC 24927]EGX51318.1 hypothetical protein AOL_s00054g388 [Orbilia oligospora ATCC 24927]KAF3280762.1 hypothetical protein TWF970_002459 [Orbilia oligospora]